MNIKTVVMMLMVLMLVACGGTKKTDIIPLRQDVSPIHLNSSYKFDANPMVGQLDMTIGEGEYIPVGSDGMGIYYIGPNNCLRRTGKNARKGYSTHCGIYVPKEQKTEVFVFEFVADETKTIDPYTAENARLADHLIQSFQNRRYHINRRAPIPVSSIDITGL